MGVYRVPLLEVRLARSFGLPGQVSCYRTLRRRYRCHPPLPQVFFGKLSFLDIPDAPDTGCADEDASDCGDSSNTGGSSETCVSLSSQPMLDDGFGGMLAALPVESSEDDLPFASSSSRVKTR